MLATRAPLREAAARRLARSYARAKPARLDPRATGRFLARPFTRDTRWHVAVTYQPPNDTDQTQQEAPPPAPPDQDPGSIPPGDPG